MSAGLATKMVETRVRAAHAVETTHGWEITPAGRDLALRETMKPWARYEISVDAKPRSYRRDAVTARTGAIFLKTKNPNTEVTVHDLVTGEVTTVKHPLEP